MTHVTNTARCWGLLSIRHVCVKPTLHETWLPQVATRQFNSTVRQLNSAQASSRQLKPVQTSSKWSGLVTPASSGRMGFAETSPKHTNLALEPFFHQAKYLGKVKQLDRTNAKSVSESNPKIPYLTFVSECCRSLSTGSQGLFSHSSRVGPHNAAGNLSNGMTGVWRLRDSSLGGMTPAVACWVSANIQFQSRRNYAQGIQKHVSALAVKRTTRKKITQVVEEETEKYADIVVAYAVAEDLNLSQLRSALQIQGLYEICELPMDVQDAVHVRAKYAVDEKNREIFFFRDGSAVFWSMPDVERKEVLRFIQKYDDGRYSPDLIHRGKEEMGVKYIKGPASLVGDTLQLNEESECGHAMLEKYAFSNALAQSVKLSIWEAILEKFVDSIEFVTEERARCKRVIPFNPVLQDLRDGRKISMSRREVLRKTGELFALRHLINLSSDLLDTPDFYWDRAVLEPLYMAVHNHLDITRRTRVMNEKLSHCCELMELLSSHLNDVHHTRLEMMIIILIMVEVVFEFAHYFQRYYILHSNDAGQASEESMQTASPPSNT